MQSVLDANKQHFEGSIRGDTYDYSTGDLNARLIIKTRSIDRPR